MSFTSLADYAPLLGVLGLFAAFVVFRLVVARPTGSAAMTELAEQIHAGAIKGLLTICFNPMVSSPDTTFTGEALDRLEFMATIDFFLSETDQHADIVLPGSLHEEDEGTSTSGEGRIIKINAAVTPPGDARRDWEILVDLPRYGEWNGFNPRIASTLRLGDPVQMEARIPGTGRSLEVTETLCALEPGRLLAWEMRPTAANPDAGRREQILEALGPERCAYHHIDTFLEPNAEKIMAEHGAWVKQGFDGMARDLKRRAEAVWALRRAAALRSAP